MAKALKNLVTKSKKEKKTSQAGPDDALAPSDLMALAQSLVNKFTGPQRGRYSEMYFKRQVVPELRQEAKRNKDIICRILNHLREATLVRFEDRPRATKRDTAAAGLLYSCILDKMEPMVVPGFGNCLYHSFGTLVAGRHDQGHHLLMRALCLIFILIFPDHVKALIRADAFGEHITELDVEKTYKKICWEIYRVKEWGDKFSIYAASWILGRPVHVYWPCFERGFRDYMFDKSKPKGGVELNRNLASLRQAFATAPEKDSPLPEWVSYSAAASYPPTRMPAVIFLYCSHYVPLFCKKNLKRAEMVEPSLRCWRRELPQIQQDHPLPQDNNTLLAHFEKL